MAHKILIDVSHNESISAIPDSLDTNNEFIFQINRATDDLASLSFLNQFGLIILGNPRPRSNNQPLFSKKELIALKQYVKEGGSLLLSSSAHGDFDMDLSKGSLRVLYRLTGVQKFYNAVLFSMDSKSFTGKKTNLVVRNFPDHAIFADFTPDDKIIFPRSTMFLMHPEINVETSMQSPHPIHFHDFANGKKKKIETCPILIANTFFKGRVVTIGSSGLFSNDEVYGIHSNANQKLIIGCFDWLLHQS